VEKPSERKEEAVKKAMMMTLATLFAATLMAGCAGMGGGPSDDELIAKVIGDWKAAGLAQDIDAMLVLYSESFENYEFGDKAGFKSFMDDAKDMGYLEDAEIDLEGAKTTIEGDEANVYPVEMEAAFGSATIELVLKKEGDAWLITAMDVEQY